MRSALCARWPKSMALLVLRLIGRDTSTRRTLAFFTRFIWIAPGGFLQMPRFHIFGSTLSLCSGMRHPHLRLRQSQERDSCFLIFPPAQGIGYLLLPGDGVILRGSRWPVRVCVL